MSEDIDEAFFVWMPSASQKNAAHLTQVLADNDAATYAELLAKLQHDDQAFEHFYERLLTRVDFDWPRPWTKLCDTSRGVAFSRWFVDAEFNASVNCLDRWIKRGRGDEPALLWEDETG